MTYFAEIRQNNNNAPIGKTYERIIGFLLWDLRLRSINGTYACACAAFDAKISVDYVLAVITNGDSAYGAFSFASAATDASVVNDRICHGIHLRIYYLRYITFIFEFQ